MFFNIQTIAYTLEQMDEVGKCINFFIWDNWVCKIEFGLILSPTIPRIDYIFRLVAAPLQTIPSIEIPML